MTTNTNTATATHHTAAVVNLRVVGSGGAVVGVLGQDQSEHLRGQAEVVQVVCSTGRV